MITIFLNIFYIFYVTLCNTGPSLCYLFNLNLAIAYFGIFWFFFFLQCCKGKFYICKFHTKLPQFFSSFLSENIILIAWKCKSECRFAVVCVCMWVLRPCNGCFLLRSFLALYLFLFFHAQRIIALLVRIIKGK